MSLSSAMFASVTGLDTASTAISVIGDNIANVSTPGFKERRAEFADVLGRSIATAGGLSLTGAGSSVMSVSQIFTQGGFESTGSVTDLAIEGSGFFVVDGSQGRSYTRAGLFNFDRDGLLVDPLGQRAQGFGIDPVTLQATGQLGDIQLTNTVAPPRASTVAQLSLNLDANATINGPFDPANANATSAFQSVLTFYDSLGTPHSSTFFFTRAAPNAWEWNATLAPTDTTLPPANPGDPVVVQGSGTLAFDSYGSLTSATGTPVTFEFTGGGAPAQSIAVDFGPIGGVGTGDPTTQFAGTQSAVNAQTQDGFGAGTLTSLSIDRSGYIVASFSNGETRPIAQVGLATFANVQGLNAVGNNSFVETRESGQPLVGAPQSGRFGAIRSNNIEQSNVDLAAQFIRLILQQRAFQANTRTVSTTNELLANLVQLGQ